MYEGIFPGLARGFTEEERFALRCAVLRSGPGAVARLIGQVGVDRQYLQSAPPPSQVQAVPSEPPLREPLIDLFVEPDLMVVAADLPGEDQQSLNWELTPQHFVLHLGRHNSKITVDLPHVADRVVVQGWRNGILTLHLLVGTDLAL